MFWESRLFLLAADRVRLFVLALAIFCFAPSVHALRSSVAVQPLDLSSATLTSPLETRAEFFAPLPVGRLSLADHSRHEIATGCSEFTYENAPGLRRWLNGDPLREGGGINLFQFCGGDPINRTDPWGLSWRFSDFIPNWFGTWGGYSGPGYMGADGTLLKKAPDVTSDVARFGNLSQARDLTGEYDATQLRLIQQGLLLAADLNPGSLAFNGTFTATTGTDAITREEVDTATRIQAGSEAAAVFLPILKARRLAAATAVDELGVSANTARRHLNKALGSGAGDAHHIIPWSQREHPLLVKAANGGFNINGAENGVRLSAPHAWAGHVDYNSLVGDALSAYQSLNPNLTEAQAAQLLRVFADSLRTHLQNGALPLR